MRMITIAIALFGAIDRLPQIVSPPQIVRLDHQGSPKSQSTKSIVACGNNKIIVAFVADGRGVRLTAPKLPDDRVSRARLTGLNQELMQMTKLRDWRVTCLGNDPILVFRGYSLTDEALHVVTIETYRGIVSDFKKLDPIVYGSIVK